MQLLLPLNAIQCGTMSPGLYALSSLFSLSTPMTHPQFGSAFQLRQNSTGSNAGLSMTLCLTSSLHRFWAIRLHLDPGLKRPSIPLAMSSTKRSNRRYQFNERHGLSISPRSNDYVPWDCFAKQRIRAANVASCATSRTLRPPESIKGELSYWIPVMISSIHHIPHKYAHWEKILYLSDFLWVDNLWYHNHFTRDSVDR